MLTTIINRAKQLIHRLKTLINYRILSILFLGFSAGIPLALTGTTLSMWISRLGIDIKTIGLFSLVSIPFSFKFLWSPIFDNIAIPYFSKRFGFRKSWLILIQICLIAAIILLGKTSPLQDIAITAIAATFVSIFAASQDIIIDALRIEILTKEEQPLGASMYSYGYRFAMLTSGAGSLFLADYISWNLVFFVMSLTILVGIIAIFFLEEPKCSQERLNNLVKPIIIFNTAINLCKTRKFLYLLSFVGSLFILNAFGTPAAICAFIVIAALYYKKDQFSQYIPDSILDFSNRKQWLTILLFVLLYKFADTLLGSLQSKFYVDTGF
jgi:PAT family beta-lactamase induction signal transducer AmpG